MYVNKMHCSPEHQPLQVYINPTLKRYKENVKEKKKNITLLLNNENEY